MPSNAFSGVGTLFQRADTDSSGGGFTTVAEVNSISGPNITRNIIDVTSLDSGGGYREFIASFRDGGEVTLNMNFTRDSYDEFLVDIQTDSSHIYRIVLPDTNNTQFDFSAWCTALGMSVPTDDKVTSDVTLKITGAVTLNS
jgi:predicted secreted protein